MRQTNCAVVDVSTEGEGDAIYAQFVCILLRYLVRVNEEDARSEYVFFFILYVAHAVKVIAGKCLPLCARLVFRVVS